MSEQHIEKTSTPTAPSALNLIFDGLFFFCFNTDGKPAHNDPAGECRVGFVTTAREHHIVIKIKQTTAIEGKAEAEIVEHKKELTHAQARKMQIDLIVPGVVSPSVTRKGHQMSFDRMKPTDETKEFFAFIIDLENHEMHNTKLELVSGALKPVMHIPIGEFYTQELSEVKYFRTRVDSDDTDFGNAAKVTAVRVAQLPENRAQLKLGDSVIDLVTQAGQTCEVSFANRCFKCDDKNLGSLHLSDFANHYNAFKVEILDQFDFDFKDDQGFPPAICYGGGGSRTTNI